MRIKLSAYLNTLANVLLFITITLIPLVVSQSLTEGYESPKTLFVIILTTILLLIWSVKSVVSGKVLITRTPLDLSILLLIIIIIISAYFSPVRYIAFFGNLPKVHGSAISLVSYFVLYFLAVSQIKSSRQIKFILLGLVCSGATAAILSLISYFAIAFPFKQILAVVPIPGSSFTTAALAVLLLPLVALPLIHKIGSTNQLLPKMVSIALTTIFVITIALIGNLATAIAALVGLIFIVFSSKKEGLRKSLLPALIPVAAVSVVAVLSFVPAYGKWKNVFYDKRISFQREIQLDFTTSWKVAISVFRDHPFLGSGPSTYLFNYSFYKPTEVNKNSIGNFRFENAHNEFLQTLATLGGLGLLSLTFICVVILGFALKTFRSDESNQNYLTKGLALSSILGVILLALHTATPTLMVALLILWASLMAVSKSSSSKVQEITIGINASKLYDSNLIVGDVLPVILFIPIVILVVTLLWNLTPFIAADYYHRLALNAANSRGLDTFNYLIKSAQLNPRSDLYRIDLAQTNFALANNIAINKGPSESSPTGSLTDQDKQNIQQLLSQAIAEGRIATNLNQYNPQNWEVLGSIYRQISGVAQNAMQFALDSYSRAIIRDPFNPLLRLNVGGIYYSIKNYDLAIRFFTDAINIKPDFANGYYNLSVALRDRGDLQAAVAAGEKMVSLLKPDNSDYQAASDYLKDLKARIATGSAQQQTTTPPAAANQSALQKKNLPKVIDLPKPEKVATPGAVNKE